MFGDQLRRKEEVADGFGQVWIDEYAGGSHGRYARVRVCRAPAGSEVAGRFSWRIQQEAKREETWNKAFGYSPLLLFE